MTLRHRSEKASIDAFGLTIRPDKIENKLKDCLYWAARRSGKRGRPPATGTHPSLPVAAVNLQGGALRADRRPNLPSAIAARCDAGPDWWAISDCHSWVTEGIGAFGIAHAQGKLSKGGRRAVALGTCRRCPACRAAAPAFACPRNTAALCR